MSKKWTDIRDAILSNKILSHETDLLRGESLRDSQMSSASSLPPITRAAFKEHGSNYTKQFEKLSLAVRAKSLKIDVNATWMDTQKPRKVFNNTQIENAVISAIERFRAPREKKKSAQGSAALKIIGAKIEGDLDLSKLDIPFSIRLIGCHIQGSLILDRTKLVTLDVSGCTIDRGISANYLHTKGAFRARRTLFLGPAEFGGAHIEGTFDFTDAVLVPKNNPSEELSYVPDRGMLNFSLAEFAKDVRLERARLYGGVNMRGCTINGMLVMNDIVMRSALAHFEIMSYAIKSLCESSSTLDETIPLSARACLNADRDMAKKLHGSRVHDICGREDEEPDVFITLETLGGNSFSQSIINPCLDDEANTWPLQYRLMRENHRAADSALRAEGMTVNGVIIGDGMRISGRFNMKSVTVGKNISFRGARFRTARSIRSDIHKLFKAVFRSTDWISKLNDDNTKVVEKLVGEYNNEANGILSPHNQWREEFSVDLESANICGKIDFQPDIRHERVRKSCDKVLLAQIAKRLCDTNEDPYKFAALFTLQKKHLKSQRVSLDPTIKVLAIARIDEIIRALEGAYSCKKPTIVTSPSEHAVTMQAVLNDAGLILTKNIENQPNSTAIKNPDSDLKLRNALKQIANRIDQDHYNWEQRLACIDTDLKFLEFLLLDLEGVMAKGNQADLVKLKNSVNSTIYRVRVAYLEEAVKFPHKDGTKLKVNAENVRRIRDAIKDHGTLNSTLLLGEICLANATVSGGISFAGVIANVFEKDEFPEVNDYDFQRTLINMRNISINGDLDFRNSIGLSSIDAKKSIINGSVLFCNRIKYNSDTLRYDPIMGRAIFPHEEDENPEVRFERATVTGDINFLFDRERGPNIIATSATISGKVQILPSRFGLQIHNDDYAKLYLGTETWIPRFLREIFKAFNAKATVKDGTATRPLPYHFHVVRFLAGLFGKASDQKAVMKSAVELNRTPKQIDIRNMTTPLFVHPPSAWPVQDGLVITGMDYKNTRMIGPLSPRLRSWPRVWEDLTSNSKLNAARWFMVVLVAVFAFLLLTIAYMSFTIKPSVEGISNLNVLGFILILLFLFIVFLFSTLFRPKHHAKKTMAVRWLLLQRRHFNTYRVFSDVRPSEPYVRASIVLRASGRNSSANEVELERVRQRERALSWRYSALAKISFKILDWFNGYGFRPIRGLTFTLAAIFLSAIYFDYVEQNDYIVPKNAVVESSDIQTSPAYGYTPSLYYALDGDLNSRKHFHETLYAIDVFVPILNLGVKDQWVVQDHEGTDLHYRIIMLIGLLGWAAVALVILSIGARIEAVVARSSLM